VLLGMDEDKAASSLLAMLIILIFKAAGLVMIKFVLKKRTEADGGSQKQRTEFVAQFWSKHWKYFVATASLSLTLNTTSSMVFLHKVIEGGVFKA